MPQKVLFPRLFVCFFVCLLFSSEKLVSVLFRSGHINMVPVPNFFSSAPGAGVLQTPDLSLGARRIGKAEKRIDQQSRRRHRRRGHAGCHGGRDGRSHGGRRGGAGLSRAASRVAVVRLLQVLLHLVRPRELLLADDAGEHLPGGALVIEERVALEAVLVLEVLADLDPFTLDAPVGPVRGQGGVAKQVEASD